MYLQLYAWQVSALLTTIHLVRQRAAAETGLRRCAGTWSGAGTERTAAWFLHSPPKHTMQAHQAHRQGCSEILFLQNYESFYLQWPVYPHTLVVCLWKVRLLCEMYAVRFVVIQQKEIRYKPYNSFIIYCWELLSVLPIIKLLSSVTSAVLQDCQMCKCTGETEKGPRVGPTGSPWDIFLRSPEVKLLLFCAPVCTSCYLSPK